MSKGLSVSHGVVLTEKYQNITDESKINKVELLRSEEASKSCKTTDFVMLCKQNNCGNVHENKLKTSNDYMQPGNNLTINI